MEETVIPYDVLIKSVVDEAAKLGPEEPPNDLIAAVNAESDPIQAIYDHDRSLVLNEALRKQFGLLVSLAAGGKPPIVADVTRWAALVRWLIRELREWRSDLDPKRYKLAILLFTTACCDLDNYLWAALPDGIESNSDLLSVLEKYIATAKAGFSGRGMQLEPIWEKEVVERFMQADATGNWETIGEMWHYVRDAILPNLFCMQVSRCLYRYGSTRLISAVACVKQITFAVQVLRSLPVGGQLAVGCDSDNPYVEFACALEAFTHWRKSQRPNEAMQELLNRLLLKVAADQPRWQQWMKVFNRYPVRYPAIQVSLGQALAVMPAAAVETYIDTIDLTVSPDDGRELVAECLRTFRTVANTDRAKFVWTRAYGRWSVWQFGVEGDGKHLTKISFSELDYAVVGYVVECMKDAERDTIRSDLFSRISTLTDEWHASIVDCFAVWYRLLSQFQPYSHGETVKQSGGDWLQTGFVIWPFDPKTKPYEMMMFRVS